MQAQRIFVDRVPRRKIISFYGADGLGKTRLAEKIMDEFAAQKVDDVKYLFHDSINGTDMRSILRRWKVELQTFGCEFPYFELGNFYLFLKEGSTAIDKPKMKSWFEKDESSTRQK